MDRLDRRETDRVKEVLKINKFMKHFPDKRPDSPREMEKWSKKYAGLREENQDILSDARRFNAAKYATIANTDNQQKRERIENTIRTTNEVARAAGSDWVDEQLKEAKGLWDGQNAKALIDMTAKSHGFGEQKRRKKTSKRKRKRSRRRKSSIKKKRRSRNKKS